MAFETTAIVTCMMIAACSIYAIVLVAKFKYGLKHSLSKDVLVFWGISTLGNIARIAEIIIVVFFSSCYSF